MAWIALAFLMASCEGALPARRDSGSAGHPDASAMADAPTSPYAGVWTATTGQALPASFVVTHDGAVAELAVRIKLTFPDGGWCAPLFRSESTVAISDGAANVTVHSEWTDFSIPIELRFLAGGEAAATAAGVTGDHRVECGGNVRSETGSIVEPGSFAFVRTQRAPVPAADDTRLSPGSSRPLPLGFLGSGCSHQPGSAARVCAFAKQTAEGAELWVVDLAIAGDGSGAACAANSATAGCLRLSERLWTGQVPDSAPTFPTSHRFFGDTLLFFADATSEDGQPFAGPVYAWRPGWTRAAQLAENPYFCAFARSSDAAVCLATPKRTASGAYSSELLAGPLGTGDKPLDRIGTMVLYTADDAGLTDPPARYQIGFSPNGEYVLWSTRLSFAPDAKQTLYALRLGDAPEARRELGVDVSHWQVSRDGKAVFWLKSANMDQPYHPHGALEMADFQQPSLVRQILPDVLDQYVELAVEGPDPRALVALTASSQLIHIWNANDAIRSWERLDSGVRDIRSWSPDGHVIAYSKSFGLFDYWTDLHIAVLNHPVQICTVGAGGNWGGSVISSSGSWLAAFYGEYGPDVRWDLELVNTRGCSRSRVANRAKSFAALSDDRFAVLSDHLPLGDAGLVNFGLLDPRAGGQFSVKLAAISGQLSFAPSQDAAGLEVVYAVSGGWRSDGLYRHRLPFAGPK
jgi:hypothetical protein